MPCQTIRNLRKNIRHHIPPNKNEQDSEKIRKKIKWNHKRTKRNALGRDKLRHPRLFRKTGTNRNNRLLFLEINQSGRKGQHFQFFQSKMKTCEQNVTKSKREF